MNKCEYWDIIDTAAAKYPEDEERYLDHVRTQLAGRTYRDRYRFSQISGEYLYHADCAGVMMLCKVLNGSFSDDSLLYFTLWVLSRGKEFYLQALADPDSLANRLTEKDRHRNFELFMSLGLDFEEDSDAWSDEEIASWDLSDKEKADIAAELQCLNGDKLGGYGSIEAMIADIPNHLPRLCKLFHFEPENFVEEELFQPDESYRIVDRQLAAYIGQLEQTLGTSISHTGKWKKELLTRVPPPIVGLDVFMEQVSDRDTFLISNLYSRKKKLPAAIVGYNIATDSATIYYESTEKMIYKYIDCTDDAIYLAGGYSGGVEACEVDGFYTHILVFDHAMQLQKEFRLPCEEKESCLGGCFMNHTLYLAFFRFNGYRDACQEYYIRNFDLEVGKFTGQIDDATEPQVCGGALFYLKQNMDYQGFREHDLYHGGTQGRDTLCLAHVTDFAASNGRLFAVQCINGLHRVRQLDTAGKTLLELVSLSDCEVYNLSSAGEIVAFDIFSIHGSRTFDKLTVFYHLGKQEYRLMEAKFLSCSIVNTGFCKVIGDCYYAQMTDYQDAGSSRATNFVYRGELAELFE